jgi:SAM-dependent methyltransferase
MDKLDYIKMVKNHYEQEAEIMNVSGNHRFHDLNDNYKKILLKPVYENQSIFNDKYALDFGCGHGRNVSNLILYFPDLFKRVDGVDISQSNIDYCWRNLNQEVGDSNKYNFYVNNGLDLSLISDDFYVFVMSTITFQHLCVHEIRYSLMKEIYRVLKINGIFSFQMGYSDGLSGNRVDYYENRYDALSTNGALDVEVTNKNFIIDDLTSIGFKNIECEITESFQNDHDKWIYVKCNK